MKVVRSVEELPPGVAGAVVALGVFDGVHLGHRAVLARAAQRARAEGVAAGVVTFDVHPDQVLHGSDPCLLTCLRHRLQLIEELGITCALVLTFDRALARTPALEFARRVFRDGFRARVVVMGREGRFGRAGEGDARSLARWGRQWALEVEVVEPVRVAGEPVSSTRIRRAVSRGDLRQVEALLGRPFSVLGTVVPGEGRGRGLGFPTANLDLHHEACPREGVYVGRARVGERCWPAAVSVGRQPAFEAEGGLRATPVVEAHLLGFSGDLLGRTVEVKFLAYLREQKRFPDGRALSEQIARDVAAVRTFFQRSPEPERKAT